jgi:UDP-N-acetylglucosamine--N-acetylmuramyl-(pentapeptide) pyrophosphoryl-undecaprenol N-acetylglucosamine transferase
MKGGQSQKRILFAGGGTAGHLMPAINIAREIVKLNQAIEPFFVGKKNGMEKRIVEGYRFEIEEMDVIGMKRSVTGILKFVVKWHASYSHAKKIINMVSPLAVVGTGGYISAPVVRAAHKKKIPIFLQEQNSLPGLATRTLSRYAMLVFTAYESASNYLKAARCSLAGNPIRTDLGDGDRNTAHQKFNLDPHKKTILVLGGSSGARGINSAIASLVKESGIPSGWQVIWQTGRDDYDNINSLLLSNRSNIKISPFIDDMPSAYTAVELVISRAGAMAISEITAMGLPSILIPFPYATGDHQTLNAKFVEEAGAGVIIQEKDINEELNDVLNALITNDEKRRSMSENARRLGKPKAAEIMSRTILEMIDEI